MKRILIDTDVFVDFLRKQESAKEIFQPIARGELEGVSSVISLAELLSGSECKQYSKRRLVEDLISLTTNIGVNQPIARKAAELRREHGAPLLDMLIASTAIYSNAAICTRNIKHYKKIKELKIEFPK